MIGHVSKSATFVQGGPYYSDQELEAVRAWSRVQAEPVETEPEVQKSEGVTREELLPLIDSLVQLANSMKNQPAPIVNVNPNISLQPSREVRSVHRDERGRIASIESEIK